MRGKKSFDTQDAPLFSYPDIHLREGDFDLFGREPFGYL